MTFKIIVVLLFLVVLFWLGSACYHLVSKKGQSDKLFRALVWRITASIGLFLLLIIGIKLGWLTPNNPFKPPLP